MRLASGNIFVHKTLKNATTIQFANEGKCFDNYNQNIIKLVSGKVILGLDYKNLVY